MALVGLAIASVAVDGGLAVPSVGAPSAGTVEVASGPRIRLGGARAVLIVGGLGGWFWTQALIGRRAGSAEGIGDGLHRLSAPLHRRLLAHPRWTDGLLIGTSGLIDGLGLFLLASALFGPTIRPFVGLLLLFGLRQLCQGLCPRRRGCSGATRECPPCS